MKNVWLLGLMLLFAVAVSAQTSFEEFKQQKSKQFDNFVKTKDGEYEKFRKESNEQYAAFLKEKWEQFSSFKGIPIPEEKPVPPVVYDEEKHGKPKQDAAPPVVKPVTPPAPTPKPQPTPVIEETPVPAPVKYDFTYFGTRMSVRLSDDCKFRLPSCDETAISNGWKTLSDERYNNCLADCLRLRSEHHLCDWAYLLMLRDLANAFLGKNTNEATLFMAYLYCQSGYKMRLGMADNKLHMLFATSHNIFNRNYWTLDGVKYYSFESLKSLRISNTSFPKEKEMSLHITQEPLLATKLSPARSISAKKYPLAAQIQVNENLIKFYGSYPYSNLDKDVCSQWATYANAPMSESAQKALYPTLRKAIAGLSRADAANKLIDWVQQGLVYEYDDKVWGSDRSFFPDETLYYPYADCEDRAILFSRLVRDLMGISAMLVLYPGHLAAAIEIGENVPGDYIIANGRRFLVCDPTFIGAPVGRTMPGMDNSTAKVVILE